MEGWIILSAMLLFLLLFIHKAIKIIKELNADK